jgi:hypothetical protein
MARARPVQSPPWRLRLGVLLIVASWLPVAQLVISVAHRYGHLSSQAASDRTRLIIWGVQWVVGFVGLWLAGRAVVEGARAEGWRRLPGNLWRLLRNGDTRSV